MKTDYVKKGLAMGIIVLFVCVGLVLPSNGVTIEKKSNKMDDSPPEIIDIEWADFRFALFGYKVSFLVTASDPDGGYIILNYKKSSSDTYHYGGIKLSEATF